MALSGALCQTLLAATGFTNKSLCALITGLLGSDYRPTQMTYDLRRLRLAGLIRRLPNTNRWALGMFGPDAKSRRTRPMSSSLRVRPIASWLHRATACSSRSSFSLSKEAWADPEEPTCDLTSPYGTVVPLSGAVCKRDRALLG